MVSRLGAAWNDASVGQPLSEFLTFKDIGSDSTPWILLQDKLGRLFVGAEAGLEVFDGRSWRLFPISDTHSLRALAWGNGGRLWAGAANEVGYFDESPLGNFRYHSLLGELPEMERIFGDVWSCAVQGKDVIFFCREKVLRWDGSHFTIWTFPTKTRLFPLRLGNDIWFHHIESGLYRLTPDGPNLEFPPERLRTTGIIALAGDDDGVLCVSNEGVFRPGVPAKIVSDDLLTRYLGQSRVTSIAPLAGGYYAIGTVSGGLALVSPNWKVRQILNNAAEGMPSRSVLWLSTDAQDDQLWVLTFQGIAHLKADGRATLIASTQASSALINRGIQHQGEKILVATKEGVAEIVTNSGQPAQLHPIPQLNGVYSNLLPFHHGLLLSRFGGMDYYDGASVRELYAQPARAVVFAQPSRLTANRILVSEQPGLSELVANADGTFEHHHLVDLPDLCWSIHEGSPGALWIGTFGGGAIEFDRTEGVLRPVKDPTNGAALTGLVGVFGDDRRILFLNHGRLLMSDIRGSDLHVVEGIPSLGNSWTVVKRPDRAEWLIAFVRSYPGPSQNLGRFGFDSNGTPLWSELNPPGLSHAGFVTAMDITNENDHEILWVGGSEGLLRYDYASIPPIVPPSSPLIRLDDGHSTRVVQDGGHEFPFNNHLVSFQVFTSDYASGKELLFQTRLGGGSGGWSEPSFRRSYEFSNLSEGPYSFEVRAVNRAGLVSEPATFSFRILPPWYRDGWAYAGYVAAIGAMVFGLIRIRERQIRERNQELERQVRIRTEELVKANAAKDEFLASVSHEIRNPMNGVIGIAATLRTETLDADSRRKFGLLRQCATHLGSLLEDLLDFSRVQAGAVELEAREFTLSELVQSVAAMTSAESERRGIPLDVAISPAVPDRLTGDPRRVRQILLNFVGNALKFSGRGQVRLTVWCKPAGHLRTEIIFAVSDDGPGIPLEEQKRLFTRFERGSAAQRGRVPGTGLGLALCKGLAEKMGGRLWLESEPGEGSCFYFSAPFEHAADTVEPAPRTPERPAEPAGVALVVDDEEYNRVVLVDLLESQGYRVRTAADGSSAVAAAGEQEIDIAFLDYDLPGMSGLDVARAIRQLPNRSARARILATTAFTTTDKRTQCLAAGMNGFLNKPVTMERLRQALTVATEAAGAAAADAPPPVDPLANMRLIARRKSVPLSEEVALYLSEFSVEFEQLQAALQEENAAAAGHYAHLLYGRCAFIAERTLEEDFRQIEALSAATEWDTARARGREAQARFDALSLRLASADPIGPTG